MLVADRRPRNHFFVRCSLWQALSKAFLGASVIAFGSFHFIGDPLAGGDAGWTVWRELWEIATNPSSVDDAFSWVGIASFLLASLLLVTAPFLGGVWLKSKLVWWLSLVLSGIAAVGVVGVMLINTLAAESGIPAVLIVLMAAYGLNFLGILFARVGTPSPDVMPFELPKP